MPNRVAYILGSSRGDGETRMIVDEMINQMPGLFIDLNEYDISYFDYAERNVNDDYYPLITRLIDEADTFIFATPVYWYTMSAVLKTFFDRFSDLLRIHKDTGRLLRKKNMALISCAYEKNLIDEFTMPFRRSAEYLGMNYLGNVHGYVRNGEVSAEVKKDIRNFVETISQT